MPEIEDLIARDALVKRVVVEYGGLPLTAEDVADELGLTVPQVRTVLNSLAHHGQIETRWWQDTGSRRVRVYEATRRDQRAA